MSYEQLNFSPKGRPVRSLISSRLDLLDDSVQYNNVNLNGMLDHERTEAGVLLQKWSAPGMTRPLFDEAVKNQFMPVKKGDKFGPSWTTHWFKLDLDVPQVWVEKYGHPNIQFEFDLGCEGLIYTISGDAIHALTGGRDNDRRHEFILPKNWVSSGKASFYIETALNELSGANSKYCDWVPKMNRVFELKVADLVAINLEARALANDFDIIKQLTRGLPQKSWEAELSLSVANQIVNKFRFGDQGSIAECRAIAQRILGPNVGSPLADSKNPHLVTAVGNCHIDTGWLWPYDETKRKVARSFSTQLDLMERYPELHFVASQAQQFQWLQKDQPGLFSRVQAAVQKGNFETIGGSWVEMDANMPSGEAIARQFLLGQRFFEEHFGQLSKVFWLPDTFGYCAQLPQLCRLAGMDYGFTQKLSWNNVNTFPHTTFNWVALDGSQLLMHLAPADTYIAQCTVEELSMCVTNHKSLQASPDSLLLFGNGDGGGGPLPNMMERLRRLRGASDTIGGLPKVSGGQSVTSWYEEIARKTNYGKDLATWNGELYLEFHRGTLTTEATTKLNNRKTEILLHDVEFLATMASVCSDFKYPRKDINDLWEKVLLNQFHDVLPGSSIEMVYEDADKLYDEVYCGANKLIKNSLRALGLRLTDVNAKDSRVLSTLPWPVQEANGRAVKGFGVLDIASSLSTDAHAEKEEICLENARFKVIVRKTGSIKTLYDKEFNRELVPNGQGMGQFVILDDDKVPVWQAWDTEMYSLESRRALNIDNVSLSGNEVILESKISEFSTIKVVVNLRSKYIEFDCVVDWHELENKFLKVEFPVNLQFSRASYESQFGITERPTHFNTSWDQAKFEVCCQKWADLSEHDYGVAILNDCKYGFAIHGNVMRLSLLRSSKEPNPTSDMKQHKFRFAIMPHVGQPSGALVRTAREFNSEFRLVKGSTHALSAIELDGDDSVILDAVKRGEDDKEFGTYKPNGAKKTVVFRLYEAVGGLGRATVKTKFPFKSAYMANILEDKIHDLPVADNQVQVTLRAFEVLTLILVLE